MGALPFAYEQETDVTMRRFWKYIEVRKKPWNTGEVVLRESADFMDQATIDMLMVQFQVLYDPAEHQFCEVTSNVELGLRP